MINSAVRASHSKSETSESFTRQGSLRRVLPSGSKENIFGRQNEDINKFYKIFHQEYIILAEYKMLMSENLKGIYVIPSKENSLTWFGVIYVRSGLYEDSTFRFNIILPESFPDGGHPKVVFQSLTNHPVIHADTNELNLINAFPTWNKGEQHLWQVLKYIQWIFYYFDASLVHSVNKEALDLYKNNKTTFMEKVQMCINESQERIYDPPPIDDKHYIKFEKYFPDLHDPVKSIMLSYNSDNKTKQMGHSWVMPGTFKPLSRPSSPESENENQ